jgi:hypothetical protein
MAVTRTDDSPGEQSIFVMQDGHLWRIRFITGDYWSLGSGWDGMTALTPARSKGLYRLFAIKDSTLWRINPVTGARAAIEGGLTGTTLMTSNRNDVLYIIQANRLWRYVPATDALTPLTGPVLTGVTSMTFVPGEYPTGGIFVIRSSRLYGVNLASGAVHQLSAAEWGGPTLMLTQSLQP